jgi:hypothetical protein
MLPARRFIAINPVVRMHTYPGDVSLRRELPSDMPRDQAKCIAPTRAEHALVKH